MNGSRTESGAARVAAHYGSKGAALRDAYGRRMAGMDAGNNGAPRLAHDGPRDERKAALACASLAEKALACADARAALRADAGRVATLRATCHKRLADYLAWCAACESGSVKRGQHASGQRWRDAGDLMEIAARLGMRAIGADMAASTCAGVLVGYGLRPVVNMADPARVLRVVPANMDPDEKLDRVRGFGVFSL